MDISKCESCTEDCPQAHGRHEAATGRMYAMRELAKCAPYWDSLFDENENPKITPDRLRELVEADRDGRCVVFPCRPSGVTVYQLRGKKHARGVGVSPRHVACATVWSGRRYQLEHQGFDPCRDHDFGKTWFLDEKTANDVLKGKNDHGL